MSTAYQRAYAAELQRLDARRCNKGVACGNTCIAQGRTCRKQPAAEQPQPEPGGALAVVERSQEPTQQQGQKQGRKKRKRRGELDDLIDWMEGLDDRLKAAEEEAAKKAEQRIRDRGRPRTAAEFGKWLEDFEERWNKKYAEAEDAQKQAREAFNAYDEAQRKWEEAAEDYIGAIDDVLGGSVKTHAKALGLDPGATPTKSELKRAYRRRAAQTHPDAGGSAEEFRRVTEAYEAMKRHYRYDARKCSKGTACGDACIPKGKDCRKNSATPQQRARTERIAELSNGGASAAPASKTRSAPAKAPSAPAKAPSAPPERPAPASRRPSSRPQSAKPAGDEVRAAEPSRRPGLLARARRRLEALKARLGPQAVKSPADQALDAAMREALDRRAFRAFQQASPEDRTRLAEQALEKALEDVSAAKDALNDAIFKKGGGDRKKLRAELNRRQEIHRRLNKAVTGRSLLSSTTQYTLEAAGRFDREFRPKQAIAGSDPDYDFARTRSPRAKVLGSGAFGSVMKDLGPPPVAVKRGKLGEQEAQILKKVGEGGIGPRLLRAEMVEPSQFINEGGTRIGDGRIAMSVVPGEPIHLRDHSEKLADGETIGDKFWKTRASLHRLGVAHNDTHTHNVFYDPETNTMRFVDFGLAQDNPKAALSEALGGTDLSKVRGIRGKAGYADWQIVRWKGLAGSGDDDRPEAMRRVQRNAERVVQRLRRKGLSSKEISQVFSTGIQKTADTYEKGVWRKISAKEAQELIEILYDGI